MFLYNAVRRLLAGRRRPAMDEEPRTDSQNLTGGRWVTIGAKEGHKTIKDPWIGKRTVSTGRHGGMRVYIDSRGNILAGLGNDPQKGTRGVITNIKDFKDPAKAQKFRQGPGAQGKAEKGEQPPEGNTPGAFEEIKDSAEGLKKEFARYGKLSPDDKFEYIRKTLGMETLDQPDMKSLNGAKYFAACMYATRRSIQNFIREPLKCVPPKDAKKALKDLDDALTASFPALWKAAAFERCQNGNAPGFWEGYDSNAPEQDAITYANKAIEILTDLQNASRAEIQERQMKDEHWYVPLVKQELLNNPAYSASWESHARPSSFQEQKRRKKEISTLFRNIQNHEHSDIVAESFKDVSDNVVAAFRKIGSGMEYEVLAGKNKNKAWQFGDAICIGANYKAHRGFSPFGFEDSGYLGTIRHESGHYLDWMIGKKMAPNGRGYASSLDPYFAAALNETIKSLKEPDPANPRKKVFKKKFLDWMGREYDKINPTKIVKSPGGRSPSNPDFRKYDGCSPISDLFSAFTSCKLEDGYGHKRSYWKSYRAARGTEVFANLMNVYAGKDQRAWQDLEEAFPLLTRAFIRLIRKAGE